MNAHPIPAYRIMVGGKDISGKIRPRLMSLELQESRKDESDQLDITLDDSDGLLVLPPLKIPILLHIGWVGGILVDKGSFTVDEVDYAGAPDTVTLRARTANLTDAFRELREQSYHNTTLGAIIRLIARRNGYKASVDNNLGSRKIKHLDQTQESDAAFLRRLGKQYDAVATIKNDTLIFTLATKSKTPSGKDLPLVNIYRHDGDRHDLKIAMRDKYTGVRTYWHDPKKGHRRSVVAGLPRNCKNLRTTYAGKAEAEEAARAEWQRIQRGEYQFSLQLALGKPELLVESPVKVHGYMKKEITDTKWVVDKVRHSMSNSGFTSSVEFEVGEK